MILQFIDKKIKMEHNATVGIEFGSCIVNIDNKNIEILLVGNKIDKESEFYY